MAQRFPRWANSAVRATLLVGVAGLVGAPVALIAWTRTPQATGQYVRVKQPIAFSHPLHVTALRIGCRYCHAGVERSAVAGLPPTIACVGCHRDPWLKTAVFAPVRKSLSSGTPIPWRRVTKLPDFVYFNHAVHVHKGISCESCHGQVEKMETVYQAAPLTMGWCLDCHASMARKSDVGSITTCTACHR